ncbi:MAG: HSP20 family small heat-shock protein [Actinomycetota bacterium]|nr:HSP20 family small heat-shock protein [Actinomycetota bacterium]
MTATYKQGILEVSVPVTEAKTQARKVEITTAS